MLNFTTHFVKALIANVLAILTITGLVAGAILASNTTFIYKTPNSPIHFNGTGYALTEPGSVLFLILFIITMYGVFNPIAKYVDAHNLWKD